VLAVGAVEKQLIGLTVLSGSAPLGMPEAQPSGIRLARPPLSWNSTCYPPRPSTKAYQGAPAVPDGVYDLLIDGRLAGRASTPGGNTLTLNMAARRFETALGEPGVNVSPVSSQPKNIEIWLPQAEITEPIALRTDAPVEAFAPSGRRLWLHHDSSISQQLHQPAQKPPAHGHLAAITAARAGVELVNLSLGSNALLDPSPATPM
jgi:hypothetical protein